MIDPQKEPLPEREPGLSEWINNEAGHSKAFNEDTEFLKKYNLPPIDRAELEKN